MKRLPSREEIIALLARLDHAPADALESDQVEFKRWHDPRNSMSEAIEAAVCFANADGGVLIFGVRDRVVGRQQAITGCIVVLTLYDGSYDETLAAFVAAQQQAGRRLDLDELLLLSYLRDHSEISIAEATRLLQRSESASQHIVERLVLQPDAWLERRGKTKGVTYHLAQNAAVSLLGKAVYTRTRGIDAVRWPELIRAYVEQHGSINNSECRQLLGLGNSRSAQSTATRILRAQHFLEIEGGSKKATRYHLHKSDA